MRACTPVRAAQAFVRQRGLSGWLAVARRPSPSRSLPLALALRLWLRNTSDMLRRLCALALAATAAALASPGALATALEPRYDHSSLGASSSSSDDSAATDAQRYGRLIALHGASTSPSHLTSSCRTDPFLLPPPLAAVLGFLAFQVVAPLAVVIAAVGKSWGDLWFKAHWRLQLFFVGPATVRPFLAVRSGSLAGRE